MQKEIPSRTARKVALNILSLESRQGMEKVLPPGIVDATADLLVASGVVGQRAVRFARSGMAVKIYLAFDWMMPGQFEAFAYRKAFCEQQVRESIAAGGKQVLVLGAGYDTLGLRLAPEFPKVKFFEIDHPATAVMKAKGVEALGRQKNHFIIAEDLGVRQLEEVLDANDGWDSSVSSVIIAEGLLMYLSPMAVQSLFKQCAAITGVGSRIVFTYIGSKPDGTPDAGPWSRLVLWLLKKSGEPWMWSIAPDALGPFLVENRWTLFSDKSELTDKHGIEYFGVATK